MNQGYLTTHVLDVMRGTGAGGMMVSVRHIAPAGRVWPAIALDAGGRATLIEPGHLIAGLYEILFDAGSYQVAQQPGFFTDIPVRFKVDDGTMHVHVPLILSAFGYTVYRGG
ncbi:MAG: hypothetical protein B7Z78_05220 [Rhodospirillales bacterium 20-60-12]|nr:MAG: hypothetical protein B7Z78_05220 [Rhodospirillales bacterium 20-60-12]HQT66146.1 hydroxyisourate hydrolase [Acetobacteraceae bacterium]HQU02042.1 hydroxyisourate hydrolase [Acetobacteraceae bacterium]